MAVTEFRLRMLSELVFCLPYFLFLALTIHVQCSLKGQNICLGVGEAQAFWRGGDLVVRSKPTENQSRARQ